MRFSQIKALVRKELHISRRNRVGTACEILLPIIMGSFAGVWVWLVLGSMNDSGNTYKQDIARYSQNALYGDWFGLLEPLTPELTDFKAYGQKYGATFPLFSNMTDALTAYLSLPPNSYNPQIILRQDNKTFTIVSDSNLVVTRFDYFAVFYFLFDRYITNDANSIVQLQGAYMNNQPNMYLLFSSIAVSFVIVSFLPATKTTSGRMVDEKINRMKELLKVMGLTDSSYFASHFVASQLRSLPGNIIMPICLGVFGAVPAENVVPYMLLCVLFTFSTTAFAFNMPALFSKTVWSNVMVVFFILVSSQVANFVTATPDVVQQLWCLHSPFAFYYASVHLFYANASFTASPVSLFFAVMMIAVDTVLYMLIAVYLTKVFPGQYGVPEHPLFFLPFLWKKKKPEDSTLLGAAPYDDDEPLMGGSDAFINLRDVSKRYGSSDVFAVNGFNLKVSHGEIFALLGHNGAGKTTTMNMLIGLLPPTSYATGTVNGLDLTTEMKAIRNSLGICPQFDVLFSDLTAREHFELFAELRGLAAGDAAHRVKELLTALELPDDGVTTATKFSGGMKRRLSAGNALVGDNSLVILDEPSSGLDPLSRRKLWQIIKGEKDLGKTVLLSTHFMEEADYLGDTIGIMSKGRMFCCGTAQQLKEKFGCGFYLKLVKSESTPCNVDAVTALVHKIIPEARLESQSSGDVTFILPHTQVKRFEALLKELEVRMAELGVHSYGVNMNTLEDVFVEISMKEGAMPVAEDKAQRDHTKVKITNTAPVVTSTFNDDVIAAQGVGLFFRMMSQINTLLIRRMYIFLRNKTLWGFYVVIPVMLVVLPFLLVSKPGDYSDGDSWRIVKPIDMSNLHLVYYDVHETALTKALLTTMEEVYPRLLGSSVLTFLVVNSKEAYNQGRFQDTTDLSYAQNPKPIFGFQIDHVNATSMNVTFLMSSQVSAASHIVLAALLRFSMAKLHNARLPDFMLDLEAFPLRAATPAPSETAPPKWVSDQLYDCTTLQMMTLLAVALSMSLSSVFAADELKNRIYSNLRVCGMLPSAYWVSTLVHDLVWCSLPLVVIVVGIYQTPVTQLQGAPIWPLLTAYILFSCHISLQSSVLAIWNPNLKPATYMLMMEMFMIFTTAFPFLSLLLVESLAGHSLSIRAWWLACMPGCAFFMAFQTLANTKSENYDSSVVWSINQDNSHSIGINLLFLALGLLVPIWVLVRFSNDKSMPSISRLWRAPAGVPARGADDEDVARECLRVTTTSDDKVRAMNVVKIYDGTKVAVNVVTLGVRRGECFGLLGPNGAGKTSLIKLMLGEMVPEFGSISHDGSDSMSKVSKDVLYCKARLGICQQHDALWDFLTGRQHMELYLRIRLTTKFRPHHLDHVTSALESVQLLDDCEKLVSGFSGGMKRKLSVALAMFTGAQTVFLDEPSTGMDPFARRALWKVIYDALGSQHAVILTTHSMEEADNVCGRIAIITDGSLKCIGNSQHLKNRFGGGYVLAIVLEETAPEDAVAAADAAVLAHFSNSTLAEGLGHSRRFNLGTIASLADVFGHMEREKASLKIQSYSISQTSSLEQIFLRFVGGSYLNDV